MTRRKDATTVQDYINQLCQTRVKAALFKERGDREGSIMAEERANAIENKLLAKIARTAKQKV